MSQQTENKDQALWEAAKRRVSFRSHLVTYVLVNAFLWALWYFSHDDGVRDSFPWPLWTSLGWGLGLAFHYIRAYSNHETNSIEAEYQKLKNKQTQ